MAHINEIVAGVRAYTEAPKAGASWPHGMIKAVLDAAQKAAPADGYRDFTELVAVLELPDEDAPEHADSDTLASLIKTARFIKGWLPK